MRDEDESTPIPDARVSRAPEKGRGTMTRIVHRFDAVRREASVDAALPWRDDVDDAPDAASLAMDAIPSRPPTEVTEEAARSILARNDSPDIPFTWSINTYRGCEHGCIYCYARPTHSYLNLSPGLDFETKLIAKTNAAELLRRELARPGYEPSAINIGSATDPYQPIEREYRLTRGVIEVLNACHHPFTLITKSGGIERDLDLLADAAQRGLAYVLISVTTLDDALCRRLEPRAAAPHRRLRIVEKLADAGVPVGVNIAPIIPFVNEPEIERIAEAVAGAGACSLHYTALRLPWEVKPLFEEWLAHHLPDRAARVMARVRELRGGKDYDADYRVRMKGAGIWADLIAQRMRKAAARHGLNRRVPALDVSRFDRALLHAPDRAGAQQALF